ncbi:MAG: hypothetical protein Q8N96_00545 [Methylovulum sp.]|nr:hypothetical protein [Methylovulum sp.]
MTIRKTAHGYTLDFRPDGVKGKRVIKTFKFKVDAVQYVSISVEKYPPNSAE